MFLNFHWFLKNLKKNIKNRHQTRHFMYHESKKWNILTPTKMCQKLQQKCVNILLRLYTAVFRKNRTVAIFRCKMDFFTRAWQKVKVLSRPWALGFESALIRPLKWGTLCLWTPTGSKMASRQSLKYVNEIRLSKDFLT